MTCKFPDCVKLIPQMANPEAAFEDLIPDFLKLLQSGDRKQLKRAYTALVALADEVDPATRYIEYWPEDPGPLEKDGALYYRCLTLMSLISAAQHQARVAEWADIPVSGDFWLGCDIS